MQQSLIPILDEIEKTISSPHYDKTTIEKLHDELMPYTDESAGAISKTGEVRVLPLCSEIYEITDAIMLGLWFLVTDACPQSPSDTIKTIRGNLHRLRQALAKRNENEETVFSNHK